MRALLAAITAIGALTSTACDDSPESPTDSTVATVQIVFLGSTVRRTDLPASAQTCANAVGPTHVHPSWRNFAVVPMQPVPLDRYEFTFTDVPIGTRVTFRVNDQNFCDENPTGAVTRNIFANGNRLAQNATTPGNGDEPGYAITVAANGAITQ
jgi:hypothetical protein